MRFSCVSLLDAAALGIRVEAENELELKLGQIANRNPTGNELWCIYRRLCDFGKTDLGKKIDGCFGLVALARFDPKS